MSEGRGREAGPVGRGGRAGAEIRRAYDQWSATYDAQPNRTRDLDGVVLRRVAPDLAGWVVVEVGCGTGKNTAWLAARCRLLLGIDFSRGMLQVAQGKVARPHVHFVQHDIRRPWPLPAGSVDAVLFNLVLEHVAALRPVFAQAARVTRPGGCILVSEFHPERVLAGEGARMERGDKTSYVGTFLHRRQEYAAAARAAGLVVEAVDEWADDVLDPALAGEDGLRPRLISFLLRKLPHNPLAGASG